MNGILLALLFNLVFAADENCVKNGFTKHSPYYNKSPYFEACLRGKDEFLCRNKYEDQGSTDRQDRLNRTRTEPLGPGPTTVVLVPGSPIKTVKLCNVHGMLGARKEMKCLELAKMMNGLIVVQVSPNYRTVGGMK